MKTDFTVQEHVPLADKTTLKIGGAARFFVEAKDRTEVVEAVRFAEEKRLEIFILGGGSNVLIADEGFPGLVLHINLKGIGLGDKIDESVRVTAQAGEDWDEFVKFCVVEDLAGIETLSGIPGCVGGTPVQNVGAYGQEVSETISSVDVFDRRLKRFDVLLNAQCNFRYRTSIFNTTEKNRYIVLAVTYDLTPGGEPKIVYADLKKYFGGRKPTLPEARRAVIEIRRAKSMVIDEHDPNSRSAGSFFKNPIVSGAEFAEISENARSAKIESVPHYLMDDASVKIPAAWLIENAGFHKGFRRGKAGLSTRHTLAVVNLGGAAARDILDLKEEIQKTVKSVFGVTLETEPVFVGFGRK